MSMKRLEWASVSPSSLVSLTTAHVAVKYGRWWNDTVKDPRSGREREEKGINGKKRSYKGYPLPLADTTRSTVRGKALVNNGSCLPTLLPFFLFFFFYNKKIKN